MTDASRLISWSDVEVAFARVARMSRDGFMIHCRERLCCAERSEHGVDRVTAGVAHHHTTVTIANAHEAGDAAHDGAAHCAPTPRQRTARGLLVVLRWKPKPLERRRRARFHEHRLCSTRVADSGTGGRRGAVAPQGEAAASRALSGR